MEQGGEGPRTGAQVSQTTEAQPPCPETALEERVTQQMGPPSGSSSRRGQVREKRQQVCSTQQQPMSGREGGGQACQEGPGWAPLLGDSSDTPEAPHSPTQGRGLEQGDVPSGAGGVQAKGLGLWPSACSDLLGP